MPENTDHPTQKPEKLVAKIMLASSRENDVVFDPFLGSGTTSVVAKKTARRFFGVEIDPLYCCMAEKRLERAEKDRQIQGYSDGLFWERNSVSEQRNKGIDSPEQDAATLFGALGQRERLNRAERALAEDGIDMADHEAILKAEGSEPMDLDRL